ncbi:MAG: hypothetical protein KME60_02015 [Cyanomargarita calcarea GSE-NOS-MK-12-04C]|jgi:Gpi18-like mannosyltransferase|uniref:Integral membrane protein n=1 Tax=Cyanomargarita calcarea GSE-NOS-MK-12-04C TaxID=2839659 RepID=A0A951QI07_9CYAN|nr:hypothetical protein [Cyanomargarita calcarea GSE-NOS-MK-12-04C]
MIKSKNLIQKGVFFAFAMWLSSRIIICISMLAIAPLLPVPEGGVAATFSWDVFHSWDSVWYQKIVTFGYEYINDGKQYSIAFLPLFPLLIRAVMLTGLPFNIAGLLVNNLSFLAALILLYSWIEERYDSSAARWATATLAWCPLSLFCTVIYTEGLFLLCSTAALRAFDKQKYAQTAFWGALSTATRSPGLALIPAFLIVSFKEKRGVKAYLASFATASGILLFSLYCQMKFGDALAFVHVQKGWRESAGFAGEGWWLMIQQITLGQTIVDSSGIRYIGYPLKFGIISISACFLWRFRKQIGSKKTDYGIFVLWILLWSMAQENLVRITIIYGGVCLSWISRNKIPFVTVLYGFFTYLLIFNTGLTLSVERYVYGIVSLSIALGLIVNRHPRWGYMIMSFFALVLAKFSIIFSQKLWLS